MNVYMVIVREEYEHDQIHGIFSTKENAMVFIEKVQSQDIKQQYRCEKTFNGDEVIINECEVDSNNYKTIYEMSSNEL